ncbi:MAG: nitrilase-related carbon-nitrogen hydrolase, partial [Ignavibacteriota bacterium]
AGFVFEDGICKHIHRKIYPPTYGIFEEERYFLAGKKVEAFDSSRLGRVGLLVCEDLWHPSLPYMLAYQGAQLIITIAASPTRLGLGSASVSETPVNYVVNNEHHIAYSRLFNIYTVFVGRVGVEDGVNFWGGSEAISPSGGVLDHAKFFEEDIIYVDIDPSAIQHAREYSRHMLDEDLLLTQQLLADTIALSRV